jgi:hypothetical protein
MEVIAHSLGLHDGYITWKCPVDCKCPSFGWQCDVAIEMADLPFRMCSSVGSTRSGDLNFFARDTANSFFQCAMDSSLSFVLRPTFKFRSIVGNGKFDSHHKKSHLWVG